MLRHIAVYYLVTPIIFHALVSIEEIQKQSFQIEAQLMIENV